MVTEGKAAAAISRMEQINREMADRRALRDRSAEAAKQKSKESLQAQGPVAEKVAKHLGELGRRQKKAGGWATEKALSDKDNTMGFGFEDDEEQPAGDLAKYTGRAPAVAAEPPPAAAPAPEPSEPVRPENPRGRGRHARPTDDFDDDDFSNNSWLEG